MAIIDKYFGFLRVHDEHTVIESLIDHARIDEEEIHLLNEMVKRMKNEHDPEIEVTYQNVKDRPISEILEGFDLAPCGIAATYVDGQVTEATITPAAIKSLRDGVVLINEPFLRRLETKRTPDVLQGLDRVARFATEMED